MSHPLLEHFCDMPDPRVARTQRHCLLDILVIALCALICGADDFVGIMRFGQAKETWFQGLCQVFSVKVGNILALF